VQFVFTIAMEREIVLELLQRPFSRQRKKGGERYSTNMSNREELATSHILSGGGVKQILLIKRGKERRGGREMAITAKMSRKALSNQFLNISHRKKGENEKVLVTGMGRKGGGGGGGWSKHHSTKSNSALSQWTFLYISVSKRKTPVICARSVHEEKKKEGKRGDRCLSEAKKKGAKWDFGGVGLNLTVSLPRRRPCVTQGGRKGEGGKERWKERSASEIARRCI